MKKYFQDYNQAVDSKFPVTFMWRELMVVNLTGF